MKRIYERNSSVGNGLTEAGRDRPELPSHECDVSECLNGIVELLLSCLSLLSCSFEVKYTYS